MCRSDSGKICVSAFAEHISNLVDFSGMDKFVELRLDNYPINNDLKNIFRSFQQCIATYSNTSLSDFDKFIVYELIIKNNPTFIDISIELSEDYIKQLINIAKDSEIKIILSYHNFLETPSMDDLLKIIYKSLNYGADLTKLAVKANSKKDVENILDLYNIVEYPSRLIAFGMGDLGKECRAEAVRLGSPFMYVQADGLTSTAEGQFTYSEAKSILVGINGND